MNVMNALTSFKRTVHECTLCKEMGLDKIIHYYPVLSFGNPSDKPLLVVALNPSTREYEDGYLTDNPDPEIRHQNQMNYFKRQYYEFFFKKLETFFQGEAQTALQWVNSPWEKVGFVDIAKCPTRNEIGQWTKLKPNQKKQIIANCDSFLKAQLKTIKPQAVLAYGADVCRWFYSNYRYEKAFSNIKSVINGQSWNVILVPQSQGGYPAQVIHSVQQEIAKILTS